MHLTVIAKAPVPGRVKTRLCPPLMFEQAAELAEVALADTIEAIDAFADDVAVDRTLLIDGDAPTWLPSAWSVAPQRGTGLAERLRNGFADLGAGVVIGMETPHVAPLLRDAVGEVLAGTNVLGPAEDGGYWAIGLAVGAIAHLHEVFDGVPMSSPDTGALQLERLERLGMPVALLALARDLDDIHDLRAIAESDRTDRLACRARDIIASMSRITDRSGLLHQP